jgi:rhamnopyranosyl-N-acetylglucosaminyl-diphospho-decaprenol beta-1,3/1,4-galactofuranosyltransferase
VGNAHRVVAVVVTWNRCRLLHEALGALDGQSVPPAQVVVVDNASTDATAEAVQRRQPSLRVPVDLVRLPRNVGGAGGFAVGIERAMTDHAPDYVWLLDDDTVPEPTALAELLLVADRCAVPPALLASRVVWTDGRDHPMNTPREKPWASARERRTAASVGAIAVRSASFVSALCAASVVGERGLPIADYFLWNDDFEYTTRLLRGRTGLYCPRSVVVHKTATFGSTDADPGDRFYFEVRNKVWLFTRGSGLAPLERVGYVAATGRRWLRTFRRSHDRSALYRAMRRGLRDGLRAGPRDNREVLALGGSGR